MNNYLVDAAAKFQTLLCPLDSIEILACLHPFNNLYSHSHYLLGLTAEMDSLYLRSVDLSETRQPNLYAATIVPGFFALVCVTLRFWSRWTNRAGFWLDDWLILCALVSHDINPQSV